MGPTAPAATAPRGARFRSPAMQRTELVVELQARAAEVARGAEALAALVRANAPAIVDGAAVHLPREAA